MIGEINNNTSVWYHKYLPNCIDDVIIPEAMKQSLKQSIESETLRPLGLFSALPGTGKSSTANAIVKSVGGEALWINASMEKGMDVLRGKISNFASQSSFDGGVKIVVMDEFDNFSHDGQKAFRGFIDEFSQNCIFILTGNFKEKIIEPLLERLEVYDYNSLPKQEMVKPIFHRLEYILNNENIEYEKTQLVTIIDTFYPRIRSMVKTLQRHSTTGKLEFNEGDLDSLGVFDDILENLSISTYKDMIQKVNKLNSPDNLFTFVYKNASKYFSDQHYPNVIVTVAKYQHMAATVRDKHLNAAACLTELTKMRN